MTLLDKLQAALSDRYQLKNEIGMGGMATVYLAHDLRHDRDVALKLLKPELGAVLGPERFLSEIRVTAKLQHPNLLPLFDSGESDGQLWYVMPYVEGESLRARMDRERQLPVKEAIRITTLIAGALDYAHKHGVIHRDLKPENILMQDDQPLLADFGIALFVSKVAGERMTQTGLSLGTPNYMSPEQAAGDRSIDGRTDIYSLGAVLYEMLTGEPPHTGATMQAIIARLMTDTPRSVRATRATVPVNVDMAVKRSLEKIPADRFDTAKEFAEVLLGERTIAADGAPSSRNWRNVAIIAAAAFLAIIAAAIGVKQLAERKEPAVAASDSSSAGGVKSVAVLPFVNVGGDPKQEYFSDGITDEISDALSRIPRLRIASRTSSFAFKGRNGIDARTIGKQLNVSALLEGQVLRSGARLRVSAQLTDAGTGLVLWRNKYERNLKDVFAVQDEIARSIASALQVTLADSVRIVTGTSNIAAHDLYLRARFEHNKYDEGSIRRAIALYDSATKLDPRYVDAYVGMGQAWGNLADDWLAPAIAIPKATAASKRAIELDSTNGRARATLLFADMNSTDSAYVMHEAEEAIRLSPNDPTTLLVASIAMLDRDPPRALDIARRGYQLDTTYVSSVFNYAYGLYLNGRYEDAIGTVSGQIETNPPAVLLHFVRGEALLALGRPKDALADFQSISTLLESASKSGMARAYAALGDSQRALDLIHQLEAESTKHYVSKDYIADGFAALGQKDSAFKWLAGAVADKSAYTRLLYLDPKWEPIRGDPRFAALAARMHVGVPASRK